MSLCWIKIATLCGLRCWFFNTLKQDLYLRNWQNSCVTRNVSSDYITDCALQHMMLLRIT